MSQQTRTTLKAFFETNDIPTQGEFADLIDSLSNILDDKIQDPGKRAVVVQAVDGATDIDVADGKAYFNIPSNLDGMNLTEVFARVVTAGVTGTQDIQIHNVTQAADMLSTKITIDSTETGSDTAAVAPVIDGANDDVAENDLIRIDSDAIQTTPAKGLIITLIFELP